MYHKLRQVSELRHVRILHDNALTHTSMIVKQFLSRGGYHPATPIIFTRSSDFSLFSRLKKLSSRLYKSRQAHGLAISKCLRGLL